MPKKEKTKLTAKINDVSKLFNDELNKKCAGIDISPATRRILFYLSGKDQVNQLYIVRQTRLKAPTISVSLSRLEKKGIISRRTSDTDMRNMEVSLTEKGEEIDKKIRSFSDSIDKRMMKGITEEEIETCLKVLKKLQNNMKEGK